MKKLSHSRVHFSIPVSNLEDSIEFYQQLFGQKPSKIKADYAKFDLKEPALNFSLIKGKKTGPVPGVHYGVELETLDDLSHALKHFQTEGVPLRIEEDIVCCYSKQTKFWLKDPDGNPWEFFVVKEDTLEKESPSRGGCCSDEACATCA